MRLAAAAGFPAVWAQDDSPVTISDGSLTIDSAAPWGQFGNAGPGRKRHPDTNRSVTQVAITMPNHNQNITFSQQRCTVVVTYAGTDITVDTAGNGTALEIATDFDGAFQSSGANRLAHRNQTAKISRVVVRRNGSEVFNNTASGGTRVVISYRR